MPSDHEWGELPRGGRAGAMVALVEIDALLRHPRCAARPVEYRIQHGPALERAALEHWIREGEVQGHSVIHYAIDPRPAGSVLVEVWSTTG